MADVPSLWRVELVHPIVVHFPIVLLMTGTFAWLAGQLADRGGRWGFLVPAGRLALAGGLVAAWVAIYTGDLADAEVVRSLCDPTVVETHEELAYLVAYLFTGALALDLAAAGPLRRWRRWLAPLVAVALLAGTGGIGYVGHLGASLVYQQGAGVYQPSNNCTEFE